MSSGDICALNDIFLIITVYCGDSLMEDFETHTYCQPFYVSQMVYVIYYRSFGVKLLWIFRKSAQAFRRQNNRRFNVLYDDWAIEFHLSCLDEKLFDVTVLAK